VFGDGCVLICQYLKHNEKIPELSEEGYTDDDDYEDLILAGNKMDYRTLL
jgi:hypothetical protein